MDNKLFEFREIDRARFDEVKIGLKQIETRAGSEKYQSIQEGDEIVLMCVNDQIRKKVIKKYHWHTVEDMLAEVPFKKVMPDLDTPEQVKERYVSYPDYADKLEKYGILGFELV